MNLRLVRVFIFITARKVFTPVAIRQWGSLLLLALLVSAFKCTGSPEVPAGPDLAPTAHNLPARDWMQFPAIVERDTASEIIALGDVHGGTKRLIKLLIAGGLIAPDAQLTSGHRWIGGARILVCTGDLIDKGEHSLEVLDLLMTLEPQARAAGGEVIVTLGNHEAEFLANPRNDKADEFRAELKAKGIDPLSLPQGQRPYGEWLLHRPVAARINDWFFAHAGNTAGQTIAQIAASFRQAIDRGNWSAPSLIGPNSLLEAREWWKEGGGKKELLDGYLQALKVKHIVFGHDPSAFHDKGKIGQESDGRIFLIDVGMSPAIDYSHGALLVIRRDGHRSIASSVDAEGEKKELWRE